jgi:hypothetical protein
MLSVFQVAWSMSTYQSRQPHNAFSLIRQCEPFKKEHSSPEDLQKIKEKVLANFSALGRPPRVAVVLGQKLRGYITAFQSERMDRLSDFLQGADVFVAVPDEDADMVQYLPKSQIVSVSSSSWQIDADSFGPAQKKDEPFRSNFQGYFSQLLRTQDAFQLIEKHEQENGWEYDVVLRVRPEVVHTDICELGLNQGCAAKGAWILAVSAHILAEEQPFMAVRHDANYGGRRHVMKSAMDSVQAHLERVLGIRIQRRLKCQPGSPKTCSQVVSVTPAWNGTMFSGTYRSDWQEAVLHVVNKDNGLPERRLAGLELRRLGYDHWGSDKMEAGHPLGYAQGCEPYPPIKNSTSPPWGANTRVRSSGGEFERAAQFDLDLFAEY